MSSQEKVNTKLEAYKLIHDPTRLLVLLYSKYGDIDEDYFLLYINQIFYNRLSHFNITYKEILYENCSEEYLRRFYHLKESSKRIPKLSEYYKNYHTYFCKPMFLGYFYANLLHNYYNNKAEIFYKNNYSNSNHDSSNNNNNKDNQESSLSSSLDNITDNKTIFSEKIKCIIEDNKKEDGKENYSIKLTTDSITNSFFKYNDLFTKRNISDSISKIVKYLDSNKNKKIRSNTNIKINKNTINNINKDIINCNSKNTISPETSSVNSFPKFKLYNRNNKIRLLLNNKTNKTRNVNNINKNNKTNNEPSKNFNKNNKNKKIWKINDLLTRGNGGNEQIKQDNIKKLKKNNDTPSDIPTNNNLQIINMNPFSDQKRSKSKSKFSLVKCPLNNFIQTPKNEKLNLFNKYSSNRNQNLIKKTKTRNFSDNIPKFNVIPVFPTKKTINGMTIVNSRNNHINLKHKINSSFSNKNELIENAHFTNLVMNSEYRLHTNANKIKKNRPYTSYKNIIIGSSNSLNKKKNSNLNNYKNILCSSRNKKNILRNFPTQTLTQSISQSKSGSLEKQTGSCDNKILYKNNINFPNQKYSINKIDEIINSVNNNKFSNGISNSGHDNKNIYNSIGAKKRNGVFKLINFKQHFNLNTKNNFRNGNNGKKLYM